ncbi:MAG: metal-dependent hydrolase [Methylococcales bacterium]|nr:metal-dependent hydrolase [Methylococcales bacterium]MDD5753938.1 metal-dependent hydrolase [Methylococcales bacterium]
MANFNVHLSGAASSSSVVAVLGVNANVMDFSHAPWLIFLGIVGGMLPDVDAVNSKPVRLLFNILALLSVTAVLSALKSYVTSYQLLVLAAGIYWLTRYLVLASLARFTVHRGIFHSVLALLFFSLLIVCVSNYAFKQNAVYAWLNGFFLGFGFLVHLLLDEMYSVDLSNRRMKKSFGTALKLFNYKNLPSSALMALLTIFFYWATPSLSSLSAVAQYGFGFLLF